MDSPTLSEISKTMEELETIWQQNSTYCHNCPFDKDEKIPYKFGSEEEDTIEICPLDMSIIEWRENKGKKIPQWVIDNWERVEKYHQKTKDLYPNTF